MDRVLRTYGKLDLPPLSEEQKAELEALKQMKDEDIDYSDAPACAFHEPHHYYVQDQEGNC